ncbi:MAG: zinc ribbon domain-containing protein [Candidatus Avispirillum sp.]
MFCKKCGMQLPEGAAVCPGCGEAVSGGFGYGAAAIKRMFSQPLYLAMCIVLSVAAVIGVKGGDVFAILFAVAAWLTYGNAVSKSAPLKSGSYKFTAVLLKIQYIIIWVAVGLIAAVGLVGGILLVFAGNVASYLAGGALDYSSNLSPELSKLVDTLLQFFLREGAWIAGVAFILVMGAVAACAVVINLCFVKHFSAYASRLSDAVKNGETDSVSLYDRSLSVRLMVLGILYGACSVPSLIVSLASSSASDFASNLSAACIAAAFILASVIVKAQPAPNAE